MSKISFKAAASLAITLIFALSLGVLSACEKEGEKQQTANTKSSLDVIKERGVLRVAVFADKYPFGYKDSLGQVQGYDVYFAKRLAKELLGDENKIQYEFVDPAGRIPILESDRVDITLANFTITEERKQKVDFALPYLKTAIGIVSPQSALVKSIADLKGKKLLVSKGTTSEDFFRKNHPEVELLAFDQITEGYQALKDGRGAGFAQDNTEVLAWARKNAGFQVGIGDIGTVDGIGAAVKKGNTDLLNFINKTIEKLAAERFFHADFEATLRDAYGADANPEDLVVEGGKI
ncbi:amino acid ABC transporter substrate-binding protein [Fibrobacterales bacterium]|nr:amino acid ABC transporter substrate-binding protein [Fibrobacterales bacterium]